MSKNETDRFEEEIEHSPSMRTLPAEAVDLIEVGDDVLLTCPSFTEEESEACIDLLTLTDPKQTNVLSVAFTQSPNDRFETWSRHVDGQPAGASIVSVEADTPSVGSENPIDRRGATNVPEQVTVDTVSSPENLTELGVRIVERLEAWHQEYPNRQTVVCFHSLTTLLQYVSVDRAFRFLHVFTAHDAMDDATVHCHLDAAAHDEETVATLKSPFDVVCEFDGEWTVYR